LRTSRPQPAATLRDQADGQQRTSALGSNHALEMAGGRQNRRRQLAFEALPPHEASVNFCDLDPLRLWRFSLPVALALGVAACSASTAAERPPPPGVAEMQGRQEPPSFRFSAPPGTSFVWTERRQFDAALVGTDIVDHDATELRWTVSTRPGPADATLVNEHLEHVSFEHDGRAVVSGAPDALVQLVVDSEGTLESVSGVEAAARAVRALALPEAQPLVDRMFSSAAIATLVRSRARLMIEDVAGRPTTQGATWIIPQLPAGNAQFTRYTVEGTQPCKAAPGGEASACTKLRVWVDVQPRAAEGLARSLIDRFAQEQGQPAASPPALSGTYHLWGTMLLQPATLLPAGAELREAGRLAVTSAGKRYDVQLGSVTDDTYEYGPRPVASASLTRAR
jgi:hypothetical protein